MEVNDNPIMYVFNLIGSALNGAVQVLTDLLNLLIDILPNPDPFPQIMEQMPDEFILDHGFALYWIDQFVGVPEANLLMVDFIALFLASLTFALAFKIAGFIKP